MRSFLIIESLEYCRNKSLNPSVRTNVSLWFGGFRVYGLGDHIRVYVQTVSVDEPDYRPLSIECNDS